MLHYSLVGFKLEPYQPEVSNMEEHEIEEVWNGRHTDTINDKWQDLAKRCTSYYQFEELVKTTIKETNNEQ